MYTYDRLLPPSLTRFGSVGHVCVVQQGLLLSVLARADAAALQAGGAAGAGAGPEAGAVDKPTVAIDLEW